MTNRLRTYPKASTAPDEDEFNNASAAAEANLLLRCMLL